MMNEANTTEAIDAEENVAELQLDLEQLDAVAGGMQEAADAEKGKCKNGSIYIVVNP